MMALGWEKCTSTLSQPGGQVKGEEKNNFNILVLEWKAKNWGHFLFPAQKRHFGVGSM